MNIREAKEYIKDTVSLYLKKDEFGDYRIPVMRQRPIFMLGAPGIGKTAIMEQIASELGIALVSYSMTHHTRQSALGLPIVREKIYGEEKVSVSEYTMSEIIASIYETMEESGTREGILFLDEINCVSETLAPSMLLFLQYKVFGKHGVPDGWVIVTAGNPPEFNKSVREFDVVTMDRLKVIEVEADFPVWKLYASEKGIHGAVTGFLDIHKDYFYHIETTVNGREYVTARGWEDLSEIISLYEEDGLKVTEALVGQYLRNDTIVREFCAYYDLYNKYMGAYRLEGILRGEPFDEHASKLHAAGLDERLTVMGILIDREKSLMKNVLSEAELLREVMPSLKNIDDISRVSELSKAQETIIQKRQKAGTLTKEEKTKRRKMKALYDEIIGKERENQGLIARIAGEVYNARVQKLRSEVSEVKDGLTNLYGFTAETFGEESNEMLVLTTELTVSDSSAAFIATFGSEEYSKYSGLLNVSDRSEELRREIADLLG